MALKKCIYCKNEVPEHGQCNKCGFIDSLSNKPKWDDFDKARKINKKNKYEQFSSVDMKVLELESKYGLDKIKEKVQEK